MAVDLSSTVRVVQGPMEQECDDTRIPWTSKSSNIKYRAYHTMWMSCNRRTTAASAAAPMVGRFLHYYHGSTWTRGYSGQTKEST